MGPYFNPIPTRNFCIQPMGWLGSRVVGVLDSGAEGPGFKSQPRRCPVTILGKLVTPNCTSVRQAAKLVSALLRVAGLTAGLAKSNGSLPPGLTHITCRLTAKHRDQLRNPKLCNRVWATYTFYPFRTVRPFLEIRRKNQYVAAPISRATASTKARSVFALTCIYCRSAKLRYPLYERSPSN